MCLCVFGALDVDLFMYLGLKRRMYMCMCVFRALYLDLFILI